MGINAYDRDERVGKLPTDVAVAEVYEITIKASFYVLADSPDEAERIAKQECWWSAIEDILPYKCFPDMTVYRTPNQSAEQKARAINESPE